MIFKYYLYLCIFVLSILPLYGQQEQKQTSKGKISSQKKEDQKLVTEEKYRTPRAGERLRGTFPLFGFELDIAERRRDETMAVSLGASIYSPKVADQTVVPFAAFYYADTWNEKKRRIRVIAAGLANYVDFYEGSWNNYGIEFMATWENYTIPFPSSLIIEDTTLEDSKIYWGYLRAGFGIGWRKRIAPWAGDNNFSIYLLYEPALLYFKDTSDTASNYIVPDTTYEDRFHIRMRVDALERNIMELKHNGWAAGLDGIFGHRHNWKDHDYNGSFLKRKTQHYYYLSGYFTIVGGPDSLSERHRFSFSIHGGISPDDGLDRYSAPRLGGGPTGDEADTLSRSPIPGAQFDEYIVSRYLLFTVEYRLELLFFMYLHLKGVVGPLRRMELSDDKQEVSLSKNEAVGSLSVALTTGFAWNSQLYIEYSHDFGLLRGRKNKGGDNLLISWSKSF